jgi:mannose-6-phosphate isomerase-like protein (cupin superfamily)
MPPIRRFLGAFSGQGATMGQGINLAGKLGLFEECWAPRTVAKFNGHAIMVVKVKGEFVWHKHDNTDDFFLVLKGRLTLHLRDRDVVLMPGELFVVPKRKLICS